MGRPKALVHDPDGTSWLRRSVTALRDGGCDGVTVVLGARAEEARALVPDDVHVVVAPDWAAGMAASLAAGLRSTPANGHGWPWGIVVSLVDLPDVGAPVVRRLLRGDGEPGRLARASYDGRPGHPVLLGRDHWSGVLTGLEGDRGAADYLRAHGAELVECGDLATGADQDTPPGTRSRP